MSAKVVDAEGVLTIEITTPCANCKHRADDHRLRSEDNADPTDPHAMFRCVGHMEGDKFVETFCTCPDFVMPKKKPKHA